MAEKGTADSPIRIRKFRSTVGSCEHHDGGPYAAQRWGPCLVTVGVVPPVVSHRILPEWPARVRSTPPGRAYRGPYLDLQSLPAGLAIPGRSEWTGTAPDGGKPGPRLEPDRPGREVPRINQAKPHAEGCRLLAMTKRWRGRTVRGEALPRGGPRGPARWGSVMSTSLTNRATPVAVRRAVTTERTRGAGAAVRLAVAS